MTRCPIISLHYECKLKTQTQTGSGRELDEWHVKIHLANWAIHMSVHIPDLYILKEMMF